MKKLRFFIPLTIAALLFAAACDNPAGDDTNQNTNEQPVQTEWTLVVGSGEYDTLGKAIIWINEKSVEKDSTFNLVITKNMSAAPRSIADQAANEETGVQAVKTVILKPLEDASYVITLTSNGSLFTVENGAQLIVEAGITLTGLQTNTAPLVTTKTGGNFTLEAGATIQNNKNITSASQGGGLFVAEGGEAVVKGKITGCNAGSGGAAYAAGSLTLAGSAYTSDNTANTGKGAGVYSAGTVTVKDSAVISEESGLYVADGKTVIVEGTLTPVANTVSGANKSFVLVVAAPNQDAPFLVDEADNGALFVVSSETGATLLPAAVYRAPEITASLNNGADTLEVSWKRAALATKYEIWYGTSETIASAVKFGTEPAAPPEPSETFVITGDLVDGAAYYVWVKSKNTAGTGAPSPRSEPADAADSLPADMWGKYDSGFNMGSSGDIYNLVQETNKLLYGTYEDVLSNSQYIFRGFIKYHKSFGTETTDGALTTTGQCGIIIIKFDEGKKYGLNEICEYYGIYYWGWGHIEQPGNKKILFLANAWPISGQNAPPIRTPTLKDAQNIFTAENRSKYLYGNVMPQVKVEED
jgi:hypothetical protein